MAWFTQNHIAETRSRALSRCDDSMWDACINQPRNRQKGRDRACTLKAKIQGNNNASHRGGNRSTLSLMETGKPNAENRDAFTLTRISLDTFHPGDKRCHVCRDFTAARCDHRASGYNLTEQRNRTCLFIPCNAWPDASVEKQKLSFRGHIPNHVLGSTGKDDTLRLTSQT